MKGSQFQGVRVLSEKNKHQSVDSQSFNYSIESDDHNYNQESSKVRESIDDFENFEQKQEAYFKKLKSNIAEVTENKAAFKENLKIENVIKTEKAIMGIESDTNIGSQTYIKNTAVQQESLDVMEFMTGKHKARGVVDVNAFLKNDKDLQEYLKLDENEVLNCREYMLKYKKGPCLRCKNTQAYSCKFYRPNDSISMNDKPEEYIKCGNCGCSPSLHLDVNFSIYLNQNTMDFMYQLNLEDDMFTVSDFIMIYAIPQQNNEQLLSQFEQQWQLEDFKIKDKKVLTLEELKEKLIKKEYFENYKSIEAFEYATVFRHDSLYNSNIISSLYKDSNEREFKTSILDINNYYRKLNKQSIKTLLKNDTVNHCNSNCTDEEEDMTHYYFKTASQAVEEKLRLFKYYSHFVV